MPNSGSSHSGRAASLPAALSMSATLPKSQPREIKPSFASLGVVDVLINSMIGSILANAIDKPSSK